MLGYFVKAGDTAIYKIFSPYVNEFRNIIKDYMPDKNYGEGLRIFLIEYHLEGQFLSLPDQCLRVSYYRKSEQSISAIVWIARSFSELSEDDRKKLIVETTFEAFDAVRARMVKKGFDQIDFDKMKRDLEKCSKEYLTK